MAYHIPYPKFTGEIETDGMAVDDYFLELETVLVDNNTDANRWPFILTNHIREPALTAYNAAIHNATIIAQPAMPVLAAPVADAAVNAAARAAHEVALATYHRDTYNNRKAWFIQTFNNEERRNELREQVLNEVQGLTETPKSFYNRLRRKMIQAGYDDAAVEPLARTTFLNKIHPEILDALNMQPRMNTIPMVDLADRIWKAKKMGKQHNVQLQPKVPERQERYRTSTP